MPVVFRAPALGVLLLSALASIAAAPIQAQGQGAELPSDFCFVFVGGASPVEWDENGCVAGRRAQYSKWVEGECLDTGTHCDDRLDGWSGDDVLHGYKGSDSINGKAGDDILHGDKGHDNLYGGADDDVLHGGRGDDLLMGGDGNDTLRGGRGDDTLVGGRNDDTLKGGAGIDKFSYAGYPLSHNGSDKIVDFKPGVDLIELMGKTVNGVFIGFTGFDALSLTASGSDTILDLSSHGGGQVRLKGVAPTDLSDDDFVFWR